MRESEDSTAMPRQGSGVERARGGMEEARESFAGLAHRLMVAMVSKESP